MSNILRQTFIELSERLAEGQTRLEREHETAERELSAALSAIDSELARVDLTRRTGWSGTGHFVTLIYDDRNRTVVSVTNRCELASSVIALSLALQGRYGISVGEQSALAEYMEPSA